MFLLDFLRFCFRDWFENPPIVGYFCFGVGCGFLDRFRLPHHHRGVVAVMVDSHLQMHLTGLATQTLCLGPGTMHEYWTSGWQLSGVSLTGGVLLIVDVYVWVVCF